MREIDIFNFRRGSWAVGLLAVAAITLSGCASDRPLSIAEQRAREACGVGQRPPNEFTQDCIEIQMEVMATESAKHKAGPDMPTVGPINPPATPELISNNLYLNCAGVKPDDTLTEAVVRANGGQELADGKDKLGRRPVVVLNGREHRFGWDDVMRNEIPGKFLIIRPNEVVCVTNLTEEEQLDWCMEGLVKGIDAETFCPNYED